MKRKKTMEERTVREKTMVAKERTTRIASTEWIKGRVSQADFGQFTDFSLSGSFDGS